MPLFETKEQISAYVKTVTIPEIEAMIRENNELILTEELLDTVYANANNSSYDNTYSLLGAVDTTNVSVSQGVNTEVNLYTWIDPNKMDYNYHSYLNEDGSIKYEGGNYDNRNSIVEWLNNGHGGVRTYIGKYFIESAQKLVNKTTKSYVSKGLKALGYRIGK